MELTQALLGVIAALVGCLVWVVKNEHTKNAKLIESLTLAVQSFQRFEEEEDRIHSEILKTQERILEAINRLAEKIG